MKKLVILLLVLFLGSFNQKISAQPGSLDTSFDPLTGFGSYVSDLAIQPDGKILCGGVFGSYQGATHNCLVRLDPSTALADGTFSTGTGFDSHAGARPYPGNKVLAYGAFGTYNGSTRNRIVLLDNTGAIDGSFSIGSGFSGSNVFHVAVQTDGKIVAVGNFNGYNGTSVSNIVRINTDGSIDGSFTASVTGSWVNRVLIMPDGKILICGDFSQVNGTGRNYIAILNSDGTLYTSFNPGTMLNAPARGIAVQADGQKIYVTGGFTNVNGSGMHRIAKFNLDGTIDGAFNTGNAGLSGVLTGSIVNGEGRDIKITPTNKIIIAGGFTTYNATTSNGIVQINPDGSIDATFNTNIGSGFGNDVYAVALQTDGKVLAGGLFNSFDGNSRIKIARLNGDTCYAAQITSNPVSAAVCPGGSTNFSVTATGSPLLLYQWKLNGTNISGATSSSYSTSVTGNYTVEVRNGCDTVISSTATLSHIPAPSQPKIPSCNLVAEPCGNPESGEIGFYLSWNQGDGNKQLVVISTNPIQSFPQDGVIYNADNTYGVGDDLGTGTYVVFAGSSTQTFVQNVPLGHPVYYFAVFEYNEACGDVNYLITSYAAAIYIFSEEEYETMPGCEFEGGRFASGDIRADVNTSQAYIVYPNPNSGSFVIEKSSDISETSYSIFNATGVQVQSGILMNEKQELDLSRYGSGVYFIHLMGKEGSTVKKVIVNETTLTR